MKYSNTLIKDFSDLYQQERTEESTLIVTFAIIKDAIKALKEAESIVNEEGIYHQTKIDFIELGIKSNKVYFRVSCNRAIPEELREDLEQKTRFLKVGEMVLSNKFCADYCMSIYAGQF
ncbi:MAG: hypothetical protein ACRC78_24025 [Planktothrix sp.]